MYNLSDTIVAVSSPPEGARTIVRITGPQTIKVCEQFSGGPISKVTKGITSGQITVDKELKIDAKIYIFFAPHSYTGDDVAEIHLHASRPITESLIGDLLSNGLKPAGPGEFTARAFLNGKIDLAQAEAVNEIITTSNKFQLTAAEKLLSGHLAKTIEKILSEVMDCLSLIEAGMDFSEEDIEFITMQEVIDRLLSIRKQLEQLLSGSIRYESIIDLPSVGIAGTPNTGKSSLLNKLLGKPRSIVSDQRKTTRDVLTGLTTFEHCRCVLFDCAGLATATDNILDELAQQAALEALSNSSVVIFCVDSSKEDWSEDTSVYRLIKKDVLLPVATKTDLLSEESIEGQPLADRLAGLNELFEVEFLPISVKRGIGLKRLRKAIDRRIIELAIGDTEKKARYEIRDTRHEIALTARHKQSVNEAIENISQAVNELKAGTGEAGLILSKSLPWEVVAIMLRAAYQAISEIQSTAGGHIDEQILDRIFSRFCIGK